MKQSWQSFPLPTHRLGGHAAGARAERFNVEQQTTKALHDHTHTVRGEGGAGQGGREVRRGGGGLLDGCREGGT